MAERQTETDRPTDTHTDRQTDRQRQRQSKRERWSRGRETQREMVGGGGTEC